MKAALRAIPILKEAGISVRIVSMKPYKDPDEFIKAEGAESYQERIDHAQNSFLFEIETMEQEYDLKDPEGKTLFQTAVAEKILEFEEELERDNYIEAVASKYQIGYENLRKLVLHLGTRAGFGRGVRTLKSGVNENKKRAKEDGIKQSQKLMLTWLIEMPELFEAVEGYLGPEDFTEELYQQAAKELFAQHKEGELNPAKIISMFTDEEQQREIAGLFNARLLEIETQAEKEKALRETIIRLKEHSISYRSRHLEPTDLAGLQKLVADKKRLQELQNIWFPAGEI